MQASDSQDTLVMIDVDRRLDMLSRSWFINYSVPGLKHHKLDSAEMMFIGSLKPNEVFALEGSKLKRCLRQHECEVFFEHVYADACPWLPGSIRKAKRFKLSRVGIMYADVLRRMYVIKRAVPLWQQLKPKTIEEFDVGLTLFGNRDLVDIDQLKKCLDETIHPNEAEYNAYINAFTESLLYREHIRLVSLLAWRARNTAVHVNEVFFHGRAYSLDDVLSEI